MKKIVRLTESDLARIVKRVIKENNAPERNVIDLGTGKMVGTHKYGVGFVVNRIGERMGYESHPTSIPNGTKMKRDNDYEEDFSSLRIREENDSLYTDSREDFQFDIQAVDCDPSQGYTEGTVDIDEDEDGNDIIVIRYCRGDKKSLRKLTEKGRTLMYDKYGVDFSDDDQDNLSNMRGYFGNK